MFFRIQFEKPVDMLGLPAPWIVPLPTAGNGRLHVFSLSEMALASCMRACKSPFEEDLHIERFSHLAPPMYADATSTRLWPSSMLSS